MIKLYEDIRFKRTGQYLKSQSCKIKDTICSLTLQLWKCQVVIDVAIAEDHVYQLRTGDQLETKENFMLWQYVVDEAENKLIACYPNNNQ